MGFHSTTCLFHTGFPLNRAVSALAVAAFATLAGCATDPAPSGTRYVVSAPIAELYKNGPAQDSSFQLPQTASLRTLTGQDSGPDAQLPKGASVTLLRREIGFSRVVTDQGVVGYVANDQLQRAPTITRAAAPTMWKQNPIPRRAKALPTHPPEDRLDLSDIPLPLPG